MNKPNQVVPSFVSVYLSKSLGLAFPAVWTIIPFDIIETDGTDPVIYDPITKEFTAPVSGWYDFDIQLQTTQTLTGIRVIRNKDVNFPVIGRVPSGTDPDIRVRLKLGLGETVRVEVLGAGNISDTASLTPDARVSNAIFTLVKRFDDTKTF